ncbi:MULTISPECIES: DUF1206 domain-containing protein [Arthrobacter]|uniref:DUF1206 domain-containing protein n=1 Tax=Arthrobacter TaxID=1663 RepID=UPI0035C00849
MNQAADVAEDVTNSRALEVVARAGFAVSGILHFFIGLIAVRLAVGGEGQADVSGAVQQLASQPAGPLLLWGSFAACVALAVWQTSDAVFDFEHLPRDKKITKKVRAALQALVYAGLSVTLGSFALGTRSDNSRSTSDMTVQVMSAPGGFVVLLVIGIGVAVAGVIYAIRGFRRSFLKYLRMPSHGHARTAVTATGVVGYTAKGVALFLAGLLIIMATVQARPEESTGLDGGLKALREQPFGPYMLAAVGAGLICYGIFMAVRSKLAKM